MARHANTTSTQDTTIEAARSANHVEELVSVIDDLDEQLTNWKAVSGCSSPEELAEKISRLEDAVAS